MYIYIYDLGYIHVCFPLLSLQNQLQELVTRRFGANSTSARGLRCALGVCRDGVRIHGGIYRDDIRKHGGIECLPKPPKVRKIIALNP